MKALLLLFALATPTLGQIIVPEENAEHTIIPIKFVPNIPEGATIRGTGWTIPLKVSTYKVADGFVAVAPPGEYTVKYEARWIHLEPFTFIDGNGKEITITQYLGDGEVKEEAIFKVVGRQPTPDDPVPDPNEKVSRATYFYEKDEGGVPPGVAVALNEINSENNGIVATEFEDDNTDGDNEVPDQYRVGLEAARQNGFPCLVVQAGNKVIKVVSAPTKISQVMEAIR